MNDRISLDIPLTYSCLLSTSEMLKVMASDLAKKTVDETENIKPIIAPLANATTTSTDVELHDGIPWDVRIHGASKKVLVKEDKWKLRRGVSPEMVAEVEAELREVMLITPAGPQSTTEIPAGPQSTTVEPLVFPKLMGKITASNIDQSMVDAVVSSVGLKSIALLAARPDLIPIVDAALFPATE